MEKEQRSRLQKATQEARRLLEEEFSRQLLETYDINVAAGRWSEEPGAHLQAEQRLLREKLLAWIEHRSAQINDRREALFLALRELAFTALNRFVALKLMEARELVRPCVSGGLESDGFQEFTAVAQGLLADQEGSYRLYLETIFEDVSRELRALFDPRDPASLLWPKRTALLDLLEILNRPELAELWKEDETLGWIYQYFNGDAERKKMREESSAPRNSRELAVRNQFFTPRYVVEFLTDNTLGRIWYEMRQSNTGLKEGCRYLVRRPNEIWLQPGEEASAEVVADEALSQEELLRQPVHISYRLLKDPREIRMLDPACGSMHFGLYAFDLYLAIYEEAWEIAQGSDEQAKQGEAFAAFVTYAADFASKAAFLREGPRLILQHNIHGVDIDPRATQIARLTLWLRAQRAWQEQGVEVAARPAITRSNVVCAEPMPGERELLADFVDQQFPEAERGLVQQLLETIFDKMQLAGEAGSLLKIEEEIRDAIEQARREWQKLAIQQRDLFSAAELAELGGVGSALNTDLQNLTKDFWVDIEERIYDALRDYANQAESGGYQRRLFAEDASGGFAFIDVCRRRYDIALMNPPFGYPSENSKAYVDNQYARAKYDVLAAFIDMGANRLCDGGSIGCISSRTVFFIEFFAEWRLHTFRNRGLQYFADMGFGVLDALVETAAFVMRVSPIASEAAFMRLLSAPDKAKMLLEAINSLHSGSKHLNMHFANPREFEHIDSYPLAYWVAKSFRAHFQRHKSVGEIVGEVRVGLQTGDDFRFLRTGWEVNASEKGKSKAWLPLAKGGEFRKFYDDIHLLVNWANSGVEIIHFCDANGKQRSRPQNISCYYRRGITYPMRTTSNFSPRILPAGCIFNVQGNSMFDSKDNAERLMAVLAVLSSSAFESFSRLKARVGDMTSAGGAGFAYTPGLIGSMPFPELLRINEVHLSQLADKCVTAERFRDTRAETSVLFILPALCRVSMGGLRDALLGWLMETEVGDVASLEAANEIEQIVRDAYQFTAEDINEVREQFGEPVATLPSTAVVNAGLVERLYRDGYGGVESNTSFASQQRELAGDRNLRMEEICRVAGVSPQGFAFLRRNGGWLRVDELAEHVSSLAGYAFGCAFGRWDIRYATGEQAAPELLDPFAALPVCPPGQLQNTQGLPAGPEDVPASYPVRIPWDGILVDDSNHLLDIERRVREVIEIIWSGQEGARAQAIEHEACDILGVKTLRDYFRKPASFFADHLKRYSKSRRQAPIYWQLSAGSGSYSAWLYYHRFTQDTLYRVLRDFVEPRIQQAEREQFEIESQGALSGDSATRLQEAQSLLQDLRLFKSELELVAPLWNPNLNDGVIINHSILWRITPYTPWQKKCKECWDKLVKGDYDWAHLAFHLWPERVIRKCTTDRSLAIAHGLEERLWQETNNGSWLQRQVSDAELQALLAEYSKPAVQNALERFLAASPPVAAARTRAPRAAKSSSTSSTRRPRGSAPEVDAETSRQTLLVLTAAPAEGLGRNAIAELLGVEAASLTAVIKQLKEGGQIEQLGAARGAKYRLSESGLAAVESQAGEDE